MGFTHNLLCVNKNKNSAKGKKPKTPSISNKPEVRSYRLWENEACNNFKINFILWLITEKFNFCRKLMIVQL